MATTPTSATAEPRGQRNWNKAEESGTETAIAVMAIRRYDGPYVSYGASTTTRTIILHIRTTTLLLPITGQASASRLGSKLSRGSVMSDWLLNLPVLWMAVVVFAATYLLAASIYWVVTTLAVNDRARAFKALSPGMLPPLGILFALLVGFIAVEVWNNFDKAKAAVATEASALRAVVLLAGTFPEEQKTRIYALIDRHIEEAVNKEWPAMARQGATLSTLPTALIEALHDMLALKPTDDSQRIAQSEMVKALHTALDARRQRIVVSQSAVGTVKWAGILL